MSVEMHAFSNDCVQLREIHSAADYRTDAEMKNVPRKKRKQKYCCNHNKTLLGEREREREREREKRGELEKK